MSTGVCLVVLFVGTVGEFTNTGFFTEDLTLMLVGTWPWQQKMNCPGVAQWPIDKPNIKLLPSKYFPPPPDGARIGAHVILLGPNLSLKKLQYKLSPAVCWKSLLQDRCHVSDG